MTRMALELDDRLTRLEIVQTERAGVSLQILGVLELGLLDFARYFMQVENYLRLKIFITS